MVAAAPGIELHVVTVSKEAAADDNFMAGGVSFHFLKVPRIPRAALLYQLDRVRITRCLRALRPDIVQAFGVEDGYALAAVTSGLPTVTRIQGIQSRIIGAMGWRTLLRTPQVLLPILLERWTIRRCRHFVTPTRYAEAFVRQLNPAAHTYAIRTPVRGAFFAAHRAPSRQAEILFVGTILPAKGVDVLLRALAVVLRTAPRARLVLIGAEADRGYAKRVVRPLMSVLGVGDAVQFAGPLGEADVAAAMARATMLVLPTYMDTAPNVVVEAQVVGTPVIASAVGGVPDMVEDGVTGLLVPPGDSAALAAAILRILKDPSEAQRLGTQGRAKARPEHQPEVQVEKLVRIYRELASHG
jgi:glycosyltransferase involved in cell wall biosynthesis